MNLLSMILPYTSIEFAGMELFNAPDFFELVIRFALNLGVILLLVRWLYFSISRRKDYLFTYTLISCVVFLLCFLLESVKLQIGFALGLFAIFGIIRYRTRSMPIKEMTYLFLIIGISVINALASKKTSFAEVLFTNTVIVFITYGLEKVWLLKSVAAKRITYEKIDLIRPENYSLLIDDLTARTGLVNIQKVEIGEINFLKDTCKLIVYFEVNGLNTNHASQVDDYEDDDDE
jgi:hypothetical protein